MIDRQCQHVALTLNLPYHRLQQDFELLGIAQAAGMAPAIDNSFKYKYSVEGGKTTVTMKVGIHDINKYNRKIKFFNASKSGLKGGKACNVVVGHKQWDDNQTQSSITQIYYC